MRAIWWSLRGPASTPPPIAPQAGMNTKNTKEHENRCRLRRERDQAEG